MKLLVFSDSHGRLSPMAEAIDLEQPNYLIHLGDCVRDADALADRFPMLPLANVRGNCDYYDETRDLRLAEYGGVRILMVHGHNYGVKSSLLRYHLAAREQQADVALFGHTHQPWCEQDDSGLWLMNPGPAGAGYYGVVEIAGGTVTCKLCSLEE